MQETEYLVQNKDMVDYILSFFNTNDYLTVFIVSMFPIVELRGAIPVGVGLGMDWAVVYLISVIGNMIPVPFLILFIRPIIEYLLKTKYFAGIALKIKERTMSKSDKVTKYKKLGLLIFVAIPLPGTGAWTGAALAGFMNMRLKDAVPMVLLGVMIAGILMMGISYGFGALFSHFFM